MVSLNRFALVLASFALPLALSSTALADSSCQGVAGNLIANCSFETGDFTGWTVNNTSGQAVVSTTNPADGSYAAQLGSLSGNNGGILSTTINTTTGDLYQVSFDLENQSNGTSSAGEFFAVEVVYGNGNTGGAFNSQIAESSTYSTYFTSSFYGWNTVTLEFVSYNTNSVFDLDNISVTDLDAPANAATPEPSSLALLGTGSLAFGEILRRQARRG